MKIILDEGQIQNLVFKNKYPLKDQKKEVDSDEIILITETANTYGFEVDLKKIHSIFKSKNGFQKKNQKIFFEGAVLIVYGQWGIQPRFKMIFENGSTEIQLFVHHQTLADQCHRQLCKLLIEKKVVKLFEGCDSEYLYEVLSETGDNLLIETVKKMAKDLPIYEVKFNDDGGFVFEVIKNY